MKILIGSHNPGKIKEFKAILSPQGYTVLTLDDVGISIDDLEETGKTFEENARLKAKYIHELTNLDVIADDSGLMIDALPDILGVYSARFMGEDTEQSIKNMAVLKLLEPFDDRSAAFYSAICLYGKDMDELFVGICEGSIATSVQGVGGFGYDPIFIPKGYNDTFASLDRSIKNDISHRAKALKKVSSYFNENKNN